MENLDIESLQQHASPLNKANHPSASTAGGQKKTGEQSSGYNDAYLKEFSAHFLKLFDSKESEKVKSYIITNLGHEKNVKDQYILKICPKKLDLTFGHNETKKQYEYTFTSHALTYNKQEKPIMFLENFIKYLGKISRDASDGKAEILEGE